MIYTDSYRSPLGSITMASDGTTLTGLWFEGQKYYAAALHPHSEMKMKKLPVLEQTKQWLDIYFRGKEPDFTPPISFSATPFRHAVWEILIKIPYGKTKTYGEIAREIAQQRGLAKMSAQAVGGAVGHNPVSIIVPCHRVIGSNGSLTGYAGGIDKKEALLLLEKAGEKIL